MLVDDGFFFLFLHLSLVAVDKSGCSERSLKCINIFTYLVLLLLCLSWQTENKRRVERCKADSLACIQRECNSEKYECKCRAASDGWLHPPRHLPPLSLLRAMQLCIVQFKVDAAAAAAAATASRRNLLLLLQAI